MTDGSRKKVSCGGFKPPPLIDIGFERYPRQTVFSAGMSGMKRSEKDIPLIITSAIKVNANRTQLSDCDERLSRTLEGVRAWMSIRAFRRIVVCDGSGFDMSRSLLQLNESGDTDITIEALCFQNDAPLVMQRGKGYGEGQIVQHALAHSRLVAEADAFTKCTAKLWVTNAAACLRHYNGTAALNLSGGFIPTCVDTRFYICSKAFYGSYLSGCHLSVDEDRHQYLEHCFFESIMGTRMYQNTMFPTPTIVGVSGSMGTLHQSSWRNNCIKDFRNVALHLIGR